MRPYCQPEADAEVLSERAGMVMNVAAAVATLKGMSIEAGGSGNDQNVESSLGGERRRAAARKLENTSYPPDLAKDEDPSRRVLASAPVR